MTKKSSTVAQNKNGGFDLPPHAPMDKLAKLSAFHAGDRGSNPLGSTIWLCGRNGRVAALSRRSLWDRAPPESPPVQSLASY